MCRQANGRGRKRGAQRPRPQGALNGRSRKRGFPRPKPLTHPQQGHEWPGRLGEHVAEEGVLVETEALDALVRPGIRDQNRFGIRDQRRFGIRYQNRFGIRNQKCFGIRDGNRFESLES